MDDDNTLLLIVGAVVIYLVATGKLAGLLGRADQTSANGTPPRPTGGPGPENIVGAGVCIAAGAAAGMPALGVAAAPLCSAAAPYVWKGIKKAGEATWDGAKFVGENAYTGLKLAGNELYNALDSPANYAIKRTDQVLGVTEKGLDYADRGVDAAWGAAPTTVKVVTAPAYAVTQVAFKGADLAIDGTQAALRGGRTAINFLFGSGSGPTPEQRADYQKKTGQPYGARLPGFR